MLFGSLAFAQHFQEAVTLKLQSVDVVNGMESKGFFLGMPPIWRFILLSAIIIAASVKLGHHV